MSFGVEEVVVAVIGEVDLVTVDDLESVVVAVLERGQASAVVDLAGTHFMGVAGLKVLEASAKRLAASGRQLTIRSPSIVVIWMLAATGVVDIVNVEHPAHLGSEQAAAGVSAVGSTREGGLVRQLRRVTAGPVDDEVVDSALGLVATMTRATVGGADGVSVSLNRRGQLRTVAASDQTIFELDADQYATGEGPCVDASVEGRWFHAEALDQESRWPAFTPKARALGINAIFSTPLLAGDRAIGALNIYSRTAAAFAAKDRELASTFATEASELLSDAGMGGTDDQLSDRLSLALRTRRTIAQAQGVLMEREGIGASAAYTLLRTASQPTSQPLSQRAADVAGCNRSRPVRSASDEREGP